MPKLVEVRCPACGAPLRIDPRAPIALCTHCRVQSRVQRVTSAHALSGPGEEGVIRVVVVSGARVALRSMVFASILVGVVLGALSINYVVESARPGIDADAVFALELGAGALRLDSYSALTVLRDGTIVVGSESGQLAFVSAAGEPIGRLDLPLPRTRALLRGLAPDATGGFYASLGGAILHVTGSPFTQASVGPPLPADPAQRMYDAVATDSAGGLHAATVSGEWVRVDGSGVASQHVPLGVPSFGQPLQLGTFAVATDGRLLIRRRYGDEVWWFDPSRGALRPVAGLTPVPSSSIACLGDGSLVYDSRSALVRVDSRGAHALPLTRPGYWQFDFVAAQGDGGVVALTLGGAVVRYAAARVALPSP